MKANHFITPASIREIAVFCTPYLFEIMDWNHSQLILETEDPNHFQPVFDKWDEISEARSLLEVFVPANKDRQGSPNYRLSYGCYSAEESLESTGFFKENLSPSDRQSCRKLTALFMTKAFNPYVGYRRLSYLLPGVSITIYDPDLSLDAWMMSFKDGEVVKESYFGDFTVNHLVSLRPDLAPSELNDLYPWIATSEESDRECAPNQRFYYDLDQRKFAYV